MLDNVTLQTKIYRTDTVLGVTYTVKNGSDRELGVFNRIQSIVWDGGVDFSPDSVFTDIDGEVLRLLKMALPIPPGLRMTAYSPPNVTRIAAGESFTETFSLPLPVKVRHPFKRALVDGEAIPSKPVTARTCEILIGVFPRDPEKKFNLVPQHPAFPEVLTASPPGPAVSGQVTLSAKHELRPAVPVLDYVGFPW